MFFLPKSCYSLTIPSEEQTKKGLKLASNIPYAGQLAKQKKILDLTSISDAIPILRGIIWRQFPVPSSHHKVKMPVRYGLMRNS